MFMYIIQSVWNYLDDQTNNSDSCIFRCKNTWRLWTAIVTLIMSAMLHFVLLIVYIGTNEIFFQSQSIFIAVALFLMVREINKYQHP